MRENKINTVATAILNKMLEKYNVDVEYVTNNPTIEEVPWFDYYTLTSKETEEFLKWAKEYIRTNLKWSKKRAENELQWLCLLYGLKIKD